MEGFIIRRLLGTTIASF